MIDKKALNLASQSLASASKKLYNLFLFLEFSNNIILYIMTIRKIIECVFQGAGGCRWLLIIFRLYFIPSHTRPIHA
jgi:hypothetical protein